MKCSLVIVCSRKRHEGYSLQKEVAANDYYLMAGRAPIPPFAKSGLTGPPHSRDGWPGSTTKCTGGHPTIIGHSSF